MLARILDWPDDQNCPTIEDQYMFGSDYLIAPVVFEGAEARDVHLPEGQWRDFRDGPQSKVIGGGQWLKNYPAPLQTKLALVFERVVG